MGRCRGWRAPASKVSMTNIRPPQQGQGWASGCAGSVCLLTLCFGDTCTLDCNASDVLGRAGRLPVHDQRGKRGGAAGVDAHEVSILKTTRGVVGRRPPMAGLARDPMTLPVLSRRHPLAGTSRSRRRTGFSPSPANAVRASPTSPRSGRRARQQRSIRGQNRLCALGDPNSASFERLHKNAPCGFRAGAAQPRNICINFMTLPYYFPMGKGRSSADISRTPEVCGRQFLPS